MKIIFLLYENKTIEYNMSRMEYTSISPFEKSIYI